MLCCKNLVAGYGKKPILDDISLSLLPGRLTVLVGANGCGKSTLLNVLAGQHKAQAGEVLLGGQSLDKVPAKRRARQLALLPQHPQLYAEMSVFELVKLGRFPHRELARRWTQADENAVELALKQTGLTELKHHQLDQLSGGQQQRAWIALVLAQDSEMILLDEPINHLDLNHQVEILDLLYQLSRQGKTIALVIHDINLASRYGDHMLALAGGRILAEGAPTKIINREFIEKVFNQRAEVLTDPVYACPMVVPISKQLTTKRQVAC